MDYGLGIISILLGCATFVYSGRYNVDMYLYDMIGAGVFPRLCAVILVICGLEVIYEERVRRKKAQKSENAKTGNSILVYKCIGCIALYVLFMEKIGYVVSTFTLAGLLLYLQGVKDWKRLLGNSFSIVAVLYVVFVLILNVKFPSGFLI
jgi:hypothetical protein